MENTSKICSEYNLKIIHTMSDGRIKDSIEGYKVPYSKATEFAYQILTKHVSKRC